MSTEIVKILHASLYLQKKLQSLFTQNSILFII